MLLPPPKPKYSHRATEWEFLSFVMGYSILLTARWEAADGLYPSHGAIPLSRFRDLGIGNAILIWMIYQAHLDHLLPVPRENASGASLCPAASLHIGRSSSFALTDVGEDFATEWLSDVLVPGDNHAFTAAWDCLLLGTLVPRYDEESRVFSWGRHVLKCFRQPSFNQEIVLTAAEELAWPRWFDDPLPRRPGTNPKALVNQTVKDLNRRLLLTVVHFDGDGTGTRIGWDFC